LAAAVFQRAQKDRSPPQPRWTTRGSLATSLQSGFSRLNTSTALAVQRRLPFALATCSQLSYAGRMPESLPRPEVIITHESDLDGLVAGVLLQRLAAKLFDAQIPLEAYHYHTWRQREPREKSAWVTDLTFEQRLDRPSWLIIDHHVTDIAPRNGR